MIELKQFGFNTTSIKFSSNFSNVFNNYTSVSCISIQLQNYWYKSLGDPCSI